MKFIKQITLGLVLSIGLLTGVPAFSSVAYAQSQATTPVNVDASAVIQPFITVLNTMNKNGLDEMQALVINITAVLKNTAPAGATAEDIAAFNVAKLTLAKGILDNFSTATSLRIRQTTLVDLFQVSGNAIAVSLAVPGTGLNFGFNTNQSATQRTTNEWEIEAAFAKGPPDFVKSLIEVVSGTQAVAILNQLSTLIAKPQAVNP